MSKSLQLKLVFILFLITTLFAFQNCGDIRVSRLNSINLPSTCEDTLEIVTANQQLPNPNHIIFRVRDTQTQQTSNETFLWKLSLNNTTISSISAPELSVGANNLQSCERYKVEINRTSCDDNFIHTYYIHDIDGNCEEQPPLTCEQDPTLPGCEPPNTDNSCATIQAPFVANETNFNATYYHRYPNLPYEEQYMSMGFGVEFGEGLSGAIPAWQSTWGPPPSPASYNKQWHGTKNYFDANKNLTGIMVRAYKFVAPVANSRGYIHRYNVGFGAMSISKKCGDYLVDVKCTSQDWVQWSTEANTGRCKLIPGETYYLNFAAFDLYTYRATQEIRAHYSCDSLPQNCNPQKTIEYHSGGFTGGPN